MSILLGGDLHLRISEIRDLGTVPDRIRFDGAPSG
jgi:hypothetical protein